mmetsp:Transcript_2327/g.7406  ORF Transcript_2327/g.7406 Transcript_2327/m.7406 type:complete len:433 (+) Transcript_2327:17-1315(+)
MRVLELEAIAEIRQKVAPELEELQKQGFDYPHTTGDIFLLRVLRGNDSDPEKAATWYRKCLAARKEYGLDQIYQSIRGQPFDVAKLPSSDEAFKHLKMAGDEKELRTPQGDIILCEFPGGIKWGEFLAKFGTEKYFTWQMHLHESKLAALDRLSRESGHIVKLVAFVDMRDLTLPPREILEVETKIKSNIFEVTGPEIIHRVLFLSVPGFFHTLYRAVRPVLPARTAANIMLLGRDFANDPNAIAEAGGALLAKIVAARCTTTPDDESSLTGESCVVLAGSALERGVPVVAGQAVSWTFRMGGRDELVAASARGRIGGLMDAFKDATDVLFEVTALWDLDEGEVAEPTGSPGLITSALAPQRVSASDGDIKGSLVAERSGIVMLRWTNFDSWVRAKVVASFQVTMDGGPSRGDGCLSARERHATTDQVPLPR